jgi:hypothetical protein
MRLAASLLAVLALGPATAGAAGVACVDTDAPDCTSHPVGLERALASGATLVRLGPGPFVGTFHADTPVELAGADGALIRAADPSQPALTLTGDTVKVVNVSIDGGLRAANRVMLADVAAADISLDRAQASARNLSVTRSITVNEGRLDLSSSVVWSPDPFARGGSATIATAFSAYPPDADAPSSDRIAPDAQLVDAGDPAPLAAFEPFVDAAGDTRITDGNGDGYVRRDIGAFELQPPAIPVPSANVLVNGGAEAGLAGWTGDFVVEDFGAYLLPSARAGDALGAGERFFSGGAAEQPVLFQRVDLTGEAARIDAGQASARLSGLVGGYGADADALAVAAEFKDPEGKVIGALELPAVTAQQRANASNLLHRLVSGPLPRRTRAIDVTLRGARNAGAYTDAYADNLALTLNINGAPPAVAPQTPDEPPVPGLRPFAGVAVLSARPIVRAGRARIGLACASSTVGGCRGTIDIDARLPGAEEPTQIAATTAFDVPSGRTAVARPVLDDAVRAELRDRRALRAVLRVVAEDGQDVSRSAVVPVRLRLRAPR